MKALTNNKKLILAIVLVIFIVALLIGGSILIFNQNEAGKVNKTNLYINGELVEADEYGNVMYLYKYDGREVKFEPKIVYHGKENGVKGKYLASRYKIDQTIYPNKETPIYERYPSEIGYYEIKYWFEFDNNDDWEPLEANTISIQLYIFDEPKLEIRFFSKYFDKNGYSLPNGSTFKYQYDEKEHIPDILMLLGTGDFGYFHDTVANITILKDDKIYEETCKEQGKYHLNITIYDYTWGPYTIKGCEATINWIIE